MTLSSFKLLCDLYKQVDLDVSKLGFNCEFSDINELNNRFRLARSFEGLKLSGYSEKTILGYESFFQVFLSHSALERFMKIWGIRYVNLLNPLLEPYHPEMISCEVIKNDKENRLFDFLQRHINKELKENLALVYESKDHNIFQISASIRHIFAHGILTANANKIYPPRIKMICKKLSDFTLDFIDSEFTKHVMELKEKIH
jgi:hypothetical protein